jgi:hypothetical protein
MACGANERSDLFVQVQLPVHALGNGLDDQVATAQLLHVLFVVGLPDQRGILGHAQRRRLELLQAFDGAVTMPFLGPSLAGQVEQHHRHLDIDQVRSNLRAHHACAEHGDFA